MPADFAENWILQMFCSTGTGDLSDDGLEDPLHLQCDRRPCLSIGSNANDEAIEISYSHDITVQNTIIAQCRRAFVLRRGVDELS